MAVWTTVGRNLVASAIQSAGANAAMLYAGISPGCGTLATALSAGTSYTSISFDATLPANLASGQALLITDGVNSQSVVTNGAATAGASSIAIVGFTALFNFAAHTSGVAPVPQASDIALYTETARVAVISSSPGAGAGESFTQAYADGTQATAVYMLVGYFGGSTATSSVGTGTLMVEDTEYWNHTINTDSFMYQADSTV